MGDTRTPATADNFGELSGAGAVEVDNLNAHDTSLLNRAQEWRRVNTRLWHDLEAWALNEAAHERRFGVQDFIEAVRWRDHVNDLGEPVKVNNSYEPLFARFLVADYPELRPWVELRRSRWDDVLGVLDAT